jgi:hypothetical protein
MRARLFMLLCLLPAVATAKAAAGPENYGLGLICPRADTQVTFYTENNQQDAAGTIAFRAGQFTVTSTGLQDLESAGAQVMESLCDGNAPGIRIDAKRDGWLQAGTMWIPPNQEWDYADWQDFLHKSPVWKPLVQIALFQGSQDAPYKDKPYPSVEVKEETDAKDAKEVKLEIYPLKFVDDYALVLVDEGDAFTRTCAGEPVPPKGRLGWMRISGEGGKPVAVPAHAKGC